MTPVRRALAATTAVGAIIFMCSAPASAQSAAAPAQDDDSSMQLPRAPEAGATDAGPSAADIVVTGSRVARPGFTSPTPVTALSSAELAKSSPSTVSEALRTLPALTNTSGTQRNSGSAGGGQSFLNLRGLGATRTLTLVDGRRFVSTNITGRCRDRRRVRCLWIGRGGRRGQLRAGQPIRRHQGQRAIWPDIA